MGGAEERLAESLQKPSESRLVPLFVENARCLQNACKHNQGNKPELNQGEEKENSGSEEFERNLHCSF